jgi:hypothetical protein
MLDEIEATGTLSLNRWSRELFPPPLAAAFSKPLVSLCDPRLPLEPDNSAAAAAGSYTLTEKPALAIRKELQRSVEAAALSWVSYSV